MPLTTVPLPYGLREVKVTGYTTAAATTLNPASVKFPNARVFSFSEAEEFEELRGDDKVVTTRGRGPSLEFGLEGGGYSFEAMQLMAGGTITETGTTPNMKKVWKKKTSDARPFFKAEGQSISDSGGDFHGEVFKCRITGNIEGTMEDGTFWLSGLEGTGLPSTVTGSIDDLYAFTQNETAAAITP